MRLANRFDKDILDKLNVGETLVYNEMLKRIEKQDKMISKMNLDLCKVSNAFMELDGDFMDLSAERTEEIRRIEALEDCVYDVRKNDDDFPHTDDLEVFDNVDVIFNKKNGELLIDDREHGELLAEFKVREEK